MNKLFRSGFVVIMSVFVFIFQLHAQSTNSQITESSNPADTAIIKLEDFNVKANQSAGYRATSAVTATGLAVSLLDSPVPINIETGDFIRDIGSTRLSDALMYVPGIQNSSYESTFNIEGFSGSQIFRNGFYRRQTYALWNIDQVEVIKGAAAVFYGLLRPGGVINYVTNKPNFNGNTSDISIETGSYNLLKAYIYTNYQLSNNLAARVGIGSTQGGEYHTNAFNRQNYQGISVTWKPTSNQDLNVDLEHIYWKFSDLRGTDLQLTNSNYIGNPLAIASGLNVNDWINKQASLGNLPASNISPYNHKTQAVYNEIIPDNLNQKGVYFLNGSDTWSEQESDTVDLTYHLKLMPSLVYTAEWNYARDYFLETRTISNDQNPYADGSTTYRFGNYGNTRHSFNFNNKFTYKLNLFGSKNTITIGQDYLWLVQITPGLVTAQNNFYNGRNTQFYHETPAQGRMRSGTLSFIQDGTPAFYEQRDIYNGYYGYYIMNQQSIMNDKLMLLYGVRQNQITQHEIDKGSPSSGGQSSLMNLNSNTSQINYPGQTAPDLTPTLYTWGHGSNILNSRSKPSDSEKATPQLGILYKITSDFSIYASYTVSTQANNAVQADGTTAKDEDDIGKAIGIKSALFNGRLSGNINYYITERTNLAYDNLEKEALIPGAWYYYGIAYLSKGIEADLDFMINDSWSLKLADGHDMGNYCSKTSPNPGAPLVGFPLGTGVPKDQGSIWTRYDNKEDGWYLGGGMRFSSSCFVGNDQNGWNGTTQIASRPSFTTFNLIAGYKIKYNKHPFTIGLSINNIMGKSYREGTDAFWGEPRMFNLSVRTKL